MYEGDGTYPAARMLLCLVSYTAPSGMSTSHDVQISPLAGGEATPSTVRRKIGARVFGDPFACRGSLIQGTYILRTPAVRGQQWFTSYISSRELFQHAGAEEALTTAVFTPLPMPPSQFETLGSV